MSVQVREFMERRATDKDADALFELEVNLPSAASSRVRETIISYAEGLRADGAAIRSQVAVLFPSREREHEDLRNPASAKRRR